MDNIKILHLEDEPSDALLVSYALKKADLEYDCLVVDTKEKFLVALDSFLPDLILADHSLPSFNSYEALELLGNLEKKIPVILVTAAMSDEFAVNALKKGARDYVLKDRLKRLPSAIKNALETERLEKESQGFLIQLQRNEHKFRSLIENGTDAVVVLAPDGTPSYVTPSVKRILGYSEKEALRLNIYEILHENHRECVMEKIKECQANPQTPFDGYSVRARHKDGSWRWLEVTLTSFMEDSAIEGIIADFRDVTERILAEKTIKESEEKYRSFFENSLDGILLTAPDGKIFAANTSACQMFQRTEKEICDVGRAGVVDISDKRVARAVKERSSTGKVMAEVNMVRKDGSIFPAALSSAIFEDANGDMLTSMIIRDISEAKRAEKKLKSSEAEYRKLFQNNPLPNIIYDNDTFKILDVNKAASDHYGFTRRELLELTILDFMPKVEIPNIKKSISNLPKKGEVTNNRGINLKKNGESIQVEYFGYSLKYKERNCRLVICLDITEKEVALQKLKDKTDKLLTAQKIAKLGYWTHNLENDNLFWSDQVFDIWERDKALFQPNVTNFEETIHPEDFPGFKEANAFAINGKKELDFEHRIILPNGKIKWVHEKGKLIKVGNEKTVFEETVQDITEHRNSLEKLLQSEARQRGILKSQTNYLTRLDMDGNYSYVNDKFITDFKWIFPHGEIVGQPGIFSVKENHHSKVKNAFEKCVANLNVVYQVEIEKLREGGGERTTLWDFVCLPDSNGKPLEIQGVGIDITDRIKAEEALKESNMRYKLVSKATSDAIYDWDLKSNALLLSEAFYAMSGYTQKDFSSGIEAFLEKIHSDEKHHITESLNRAVEGMENHRIAEYRFQKANGKYASVIDKGFILRDAKGKAFRMVGAIQDITNIKNSELAALKASEEKEIILESIGDAFFMVDNDWIVTYWNRHSEALLECVREEIIDKNLWEVFPDAVDTQFYTSYRKAVAEKSIENFEEYFDRVNKWFEVTAYPSQSGLSVYFKDVTERKESELQIIRLNNNLKAHTEELVEANKGLEQFSFIVSHNLRSPVANIIGLADLIGNKEYPEDVKNDFLKELLDNVQRLDIVISDLNTILQVKVEMDAKKEPVILNNLVNAIKISIQNLIEKEEVQITTSFDVPAIHTVQSYLHSIFYNLIANSIKYRKPGVTPQIEIKSETKQGAVVITFEDNGLGIDLVKKGEQVFGLYRRFHNHIEGKGMGLFLVKTQVELLGGRISIESEVNAGTKFTISFKEETLNYFSEYEETTLYGSR